ncbi:MAG: hypothetical protein J7L23_00770 [Candidatus Diapherotrites archaeon]|nr:hypothetical protein [Candidatus Diapherotrites archaeon]
MAELKKQAHFKDIPKIVVLHAIESISAALIQDAKYNYGREFGFDSSLEMKEAQGLVESSVKFFPYTYNFRWLVAPDEGGYLVTFIGKTPGSWWEFLYSMDKKLDNLMETQWAALINFGIGYLTAKYYTKSVKSPGPTSPPKEHIKKARNKLVQKIGKEQKKTPIDKR